MSQEMYTTSPILGGSLMNLAVSFIARNHVDTSWWPNIVGGIGFMLAGMGILGTWQFCIADKSPTWAWVSYVPGYLLLGPAVLIFYRTSPYKGLFYVGSFLLGITVISLLHIHISALFNSTRDK